jgi:hypothetical protein
MPPEKLKELIKETSEYRLAICKDCEESSMFKVEHHVSFPSSWRKDEHCTVCLCPLLQKTKALHSSCPMNPPKWERVVSDSESIQINNTIENAKERTSQ